MSAHVERRIQRVMMQACRSGRAQAYAAMSALILVLHPASFGAACAADITGATPQAMAWTQRRAGPDVFHAAIYGEPGAPGAYAFRIRAQAGHALPPHTHPDERTVTVLHGTYWTGVGEAFDRDKLVAWPAGSFYVIPAGLPHFSAVLEGEVEFQEAGVGPSRHDVIGSQPR